MSICFQTLKEYIADDDNSLNGTQLNVDCVHCTYFQKGIFSAGVEVECASDGGGGGCAGDGDGGGAPGLAGAEGARGDAMRGKF